MAPDVLHYPFKGNVHKKREKFAKHILWSVYVRKNGADAHKKSSKEKCDANCILQSLQRTSKALC